MAINGYLMPAVVAMQVFLKCRMLGLALRISFGFSKRLVFGLQTLTVKPRLLPGEKH